jgi:hypothetical protein
MSFDKLRKHVRKHPFKPFRVYVSDGSRYDIHHHDFMIVAKGVVEIGVTGGPDEYPTRIISCDPLHITRIEPLSSRHRSNGKKTRP